MKYTSIYIAIDVFRDSRDPEAFNVIYKTFSPKLYYVCLRYLKNDADSQDVLQETFVTAYHKIGTFEGTGSFEGWMRRIAVNHCLAKLKLDKKHFEAELSGNETELLVSEEEEYLQKEETETNLLRALKGLPDGYRTIINLAILEDYSHREIGELLHITESTSRSQLSRAKAALKLKLEQDEKQ